MLNNFIPRQTSLPVDMKIQLGINFSVDQSFNVTYSDIYSEAERDLTRL